MAVGLVQEGYMQEFSAIKMYRRNTLGITFSIIGMMDGLLAYQLVQFLHLKQTRSEKNHVDFVDMIG